MATRKPYKMSWANLLYSILCWPSRKCKLTAEARLHKKYQVYACGEKKIMQELDIKQL